VEPLKLSVEMFTFGNLAVDKEHLLQNLPTSSTSLTTWSDSSRRLCNKASLHLTPLLSHRLLESGKAKHSGWDLLILSVEMFQHHPR